MIQHVTIFLQGKARGAQNRSGCVTTRGFEHHSNAAMERKMGVLKRYKGFTLIELLVSIAVLGIMLAVIGQAFSLGHRSRARGEKVMMQSLQLRTGIDLLSKQLRSAFPLVTRNKDENKDILQFSGDANSVRFFSTLPFGTRRRGGLFRVRYFLGKEEAGGRRVLMVDQRPAYDKEMSGRPEAAQGGVALLPELFSADWAYFDGKEWREHWDKEERDQLPEKVRLTLRTPQGKKERVHEIIVPIQAKLDLDKVEGKWERREDL